MKFVQHQYVISHEDETVVRTLFMYLCQFRHEYIPSLMRQSIANCLERLVVVQNTLAPFWLKRVSMILSSDEIETITALISMFRMPPKELNHVAVHSRKAACSVFKKALASYEQGASLVCYEHRSRLLTGTGIDTFSQLSPILRSRMARLSSSSVSQWILVLYVS
jgi:hypothetical protein